MQIVCRSDTLALIKIEFYLLIERGLSSFVRSIKGISNGNNGK